MSIFENEQEKNAFYFWYTHFGNIGPAELFSLNDQQQDFIKGVRSVIHWSWEERPYKDQNRMDGLLKNMQKNPDWLQELHRRYVR